MPDSDLRPPLSTPALARRSGFPARGIPFSLSVHLVAFVTLLLLREAPSVRTVDTQHPPLRHVLEIPLSLETATSLRPDGSSGTHGSSEALKGSAASPAKSLEVTYAGPQHLVSNPPDPDNSVQTILQPDIPSPPRLAVPIPVPSVVKVAMAQAPPVLPTSRINVNVQPPTPPDPVASAPPRLPTVQHTQVETVALTPAATPVDLPKLPVPATTGSAYTPAARELPQAEPRPSAPPPQPSVNAASKPPNAPSKARSGQGQDEKNLLVMNAVEVQSANSDQMIPEKEIHGRFEVSAAAAAGPPSTSASRSTTASEAQGGKGSSPLQASTGSASGPGSSASGSGATSGTGNEAHTTSAKGVGTGAGTGAGAAGKELAGGSGAGSQSGHSPFLNMTIDGGKGSGTGSSASAKKAPAEPVHHESYGMTIISSGSSGGGLRDFGVFNDGPVYTVYLDVSKLGIRGVRWSMQYGASRDVRVAHPGTILTPPYAANQTLPRFPSALVTPNVGRMLVVQALLSVEGVLESVRILQSPDPRLNDLLKECLTRWSFDAASMGKEPVPVKVLLGIPIAANMAADTEATQRSN